MSTPQHQEFKHSNVTVYSWHEYSLFFIYFTLLEIRECYFYVSSWYVILSVAVTGKKRLSSRLAATVSRGHWQTTLRQENLIISNFASFRSNSTGLQDTEVPISDGVWPHCSLPGVAQQCSLPGGPAEPQDSNGQPAQLCLHLWALHRLEMPQLSAEGGTAGEIQKLWHCKQNMLLSKFFLSFVTSSLLQSPSHPFSLLPLNALSQAIHPSPLQNSHY